MSASKKGSVIYIMFLCAITPISVNIASVSANGVDLSPRTSVGLSMCVGRSVGRSVCLSVCLSVWKVYSGNTTDWIRMLFGMVSGVGQGMGVLDEVVNVEGEGAVSGVNLGCT